MAALIKHWESQITKGADRHKRWQLGRKRLVSPWPAIRPCSKFALSNFYASPVQKFLGDVSRGSFQGKIGGSADATKGEKADFGWRESLVTGGIMALISSKQKVHRFFFNAHDHLCFRCLVLIEIPMWMRTTIRCVSSMSKD